MSNSELIQNLRAVMIARGYRFEDSDAEVRMFRPDGTLAMVVRRPYLQSFGVNGDQ